MTGSFYKSRRGRPPVRAFFGITSSPSLSAILSQFRMVSCLTSRPPFLASSVARSVTISPMRKSSGFPDHISEAVSIQNLRNSSVDACLFKAFFRDSSEIALFFSAAKSILELVSAVIPMKKGLMNLQEGPSSCHHSIHNSVYTLANHTSSRSSSRGFGPFITSLALFRSSLRYGSAGGQNSESEAWSRNDSYP